MPDLTTHNEWRDLPPRGNACTNCGDNDVLGSATLRLNQPSRTHHNQAIAPAHYCEVCTQSVCHDCGIAVWLHSIFLQQATVARYDSSVSPEERNALQEMANNALTVGNRRNLFFTNVSLCHACLDARGLRRCESCRGWANADRLRFTDDNHNTRYAHEGECERTLRNGTQTSSDTSGIMSLQEITFEDGNICPHNL